MVSTTVIRSLRAPYHPPVLLASSFTSTAQTTTTASVTSAISQTTLVATSSSTNSALITASGRSSFSLSAPLPCSSTSSSSSAVASSSTRIADPNIPILFPLNKDLVSAIALDTLFKQTGLENYAKHADNHQQITEHLANRINLYIKASPSSPTCDFEDISAPIIPNIPLSYRAWVKVNREKVHLKIGAIAPSLLAHGTHKHIYRLHSFTINLIQRIACFSHEVSMKIEKKKPKEETKTNEDEKEAEVAKKEKEKWVKHVQSYFEKGIEIQRDLIESAKLENTELCIAPPPEILSLSPEKQWHAPRYNCNLAAALKKGFIPGFDKAPIPFTIKDALQALIHVIKTLIFIHESRYVHRDFKLDNILLQVKLDVHVNKILPAIIDFDICSPIGKSWEPEEPCDHWDDLANRGFPHPLTDCFSFAYSLQRCLIDYQSLKIPKFLEFGFEELSLFRIDPDGYLREQLWKHKLRMFAKTETQTIKQFLAFIAELEVLNSLNQLGEQIKKDVINFNQLVKNKFPDDTITNDTFDIEEEYDNYDGFKMSNIHQRLIRILDTYNKNLILNKIELEKITASNPSSTS